MKSDSDTNDPPSLVIPNISAPHLRYSPPKLFLPNIPPSKYFPPKLIIPNISPTILNRYQPSSNLY